jgi:tol-pal system protein YbgF
LLPAALLLLCGCYGKHLVREPLNVNETKEDVEALRSEMTEVQTRMDALEQLLQSHDADQSSLRATFQMQLEEIQEQLRSLTIQNQEMMNLLAMGSVEGSPEASYEDYSPEPSVPRDPPEWEVPKREFEVSEDVTGGQESPQEIPQESFQESPPDSPAESPPNSEEQSPQSAESREPEETTPTTPAVPTPPPAAGAELRDARPLYDAAYLNLTQGNYQLSLMEFREYLQRFPDTNLTDNAQYWIGEVYYAQSQYDQAVEEFLKVVDQYPEADKVPAAYLKTAYSFRRLGDVPTARRYLRLIMDRYPDSEESRLARQKLAEFR